MKRSPLLSSLADRLLARGRTLLAYARLRWRRLLPAALLLPFVLMGALWVAVDLGLTGPIPSARALRTMRNAVASEVYATDGSQLGKYFLENRTNVAYDAIAPGLIEALVATEDERFYEHGGIDYRSLGRVAIKTLLLRRESAGGGSTLSQQLAKNLFPRRDYGPLSLPINKVREMKVARRLERLYGKQEILTLYLNTVPFGGNVYGVEAAARRFFNVPAAALRHEQAAVLVGMLKATTSYNPRLYPERAHARRNVVFGQMVKNGALTAAAADSLGALPLALDYQFRTHHEGPAAYFREHLRQELTAWCRDHQKPDGTPYNLYTDGLRVYTTIDATLQRYAEAAVARRMSGLQKEFFQHWRNRAPWDRAPDMLRAAQRRSARYRLLKAAGRTDEEIDAAFTEPTTMTVFSWDGEQEREWTPLDSLRYHQMFLNAGFLAMDPRSGQILAWVGGINHEYFQYDHVLARRQVGSTFKPLVYATALADGVDPCEFIPNERRTYPEYDDWSPGNADGKYGGFYSVKGGLTHSVNTVAVDLITRTGVRPVADLAHSMGITHDLPDGPALALGAADLSLLEMVNVYGTLANGGVHVPPRYLLRIEDAEGRVLANFDPKRPPQRVLDRDVADLTTALLQAVVDSG
ncbi:MAG: transglycosylase domain-containing protein, partial [Catalinimonas sp.]